MTGGDERCHNCRTVDADIYHHHLLKLKWYADGGVHTLALPHRDGITVGSWVVPSPIPGTPPWEWAVTNMPVTVVPGMSAGYADTQAEAEHARDVALKFWGDLGYHISADDHKTTG